MAERNSKLGEMAEQLDENIVAVKGTLELIDASVTDDDLRGLLLKAIHRMDAIEGLTKEMLAALEKCFEKIGGIKG